ncbi:MAG TPA: exodeoxyribonuclease III [Sedimenticola thiotaurini]|uniref:Exodeoxyribonuclease III n=1 Tax=Sedimenticola thiotaurini TaxID=1543721 RepID=A0A831W462_9GAMM|nr:exodeoxyribonuclease III [Sedimenticola thiotaurini]
MRLVSFNVNGIRARPHQLEALKRQYGPDVIGIQESKVQDPEFPLEMVHALGYHAEYFGQKGHYGVALLSRRAPLSVRMGCPFDDGDAQRRLITGVFESDAGERFTVVNGYFPQGENRDHPVKFPAKQRFYADLLNYLRTEFSPDDNLVLMGDMNIAPGDLDIGIGADNARRWLRSGKCSFLPEEREWLEQLLGWGLGDTYRHCHPDAGDRFSWFDYRSRGFDREPKRGLRIDLILASRPMLERCTGAGIAYDIRAMEKPSDHCPVWADFEL